MTVYRDARLLIDGELVEATGRGHFDNENPATEEILGQVPNATADDARRYRDQKEVDAWKAKDPIIRFRKYLVDRKLWSDAQEAALKEQAERDVAAAVKRAEEIAAPTSADIFNHMYAELPADLVRQREEMETHSLASEGAGVEREESGIRN